MTPEELEKAKGFLADAAAWGDEYATLGLTLVAEVERLRKALHIAAGCLNNASHRMTEAEQYRTAAVFANWAAEARKALEA